MLVFVSLAVIALCHTAFSLSATDKLLDAGNVSCRGWLGHDVKHS